MAVYPAGNRRRRTSCAWTRLLEASEWNRRDPPANRGPEGGGRAPRARAPRHRLRRPLPAPRPRTPRPAPGRGRLPRPLPRPDRGRPPPRPDSRRHGDPGLEGRPGAERAARHAQAPAPGDGRDPRPWPRRSTTSTTCSSIPSRPGLRALAGVAASALPGLRDDRAPAPRSAPRARPGLGAALRVARACPAERRRGQRRRGAGGAGRDAVASPRAGPPGARPGRSQDRPGDLGEAAERGARRARSGERRSAGTTGASTT